MVDNMRHRDLKCLLEGAALRQAGRLLGQLLPTVVPRGGGHLGAEDGQGGHGWLGQVDTTQCIVQPLITLVNISKMNSVSGN